MKNLYLNLIIFSFASSLVLLSCNNDREMSKPLEKNSIHSASSRMGSIIPANSANPYDDAGRLHNEFLESYYVSESLPHTISDVIDRVDSIAHANSEFTGIMGATYQPVSAARVQYVISNNTNSISEIINGSGMTTPAKSSLNNFISSLLLLSDTEESTDVLYNFIVNYEMEITNDSQLTEYDRKIILTASSIARYSTYMDKKRPKRNTDPDWLVFVGNFAGGIEGATDGEAKAITEALVLGIAQNQ